MEFFEHEINGVIGRMFRSHDNSARATGCWVAQFWESQLRSYKAYAPGAQMRVVIRFDDSCGNKHNSFSITADIYTPASRRKNDVAACGCLHDEIEKVFPELAPLIKWHLCSTDGPMHYIANTTYLAGNRDCNGLKKGEKRQIRKGSTGKLCWELAVVGVDSTLVLNKVVDADEAPTAPILEYRPLYQIGEGKEHQFDEARRAAVWPDATAGELVLPKEYLTNLLEARLPKLIEQMKVELESAGFAWSTPND